MSKTVVELERSLRASRAENLELRRRLERCKWALDLSLSRLAQQADDLGKILKEEFEWEASRPG